MDMEEPFKNENLKFPLLCHFKIIGEGNEEVLKAEIKKVLLSLDETAEVSRGNQSSSGRYMTYNVSISVDSLEHMSTIDKALRSVKGVRMVL